MNDQHEDDLPTKLPFPGGPVELTADFAAPAPPEPRSTTEPELIGKVLKRVLGELQDLEDFTDSRGEWFARMRTAMRELRAAEKATRPPVFEPVRAERAYLDVL